MRSPQLQVATNVQSQPETQGQPESKKSKKLSTDDRRADDDRELRSQITELNAENYSTIIKPTSSSFYIDDSNCQDPGVGDSTRMMHLLENVSENVSGFGSSMAELPGVIKEAVKLGIKEGVSSAMEVLQQRGYEPAGSKTKAMTSSSKRQDQQRRDQAWTDLKSAMPVAIYSVLEVSNSYRSEPE